VAGARGDLRGPVCKQACLIAIFSVGKRLMPRNFSADYISNEPMLAYQVHFGLTNSPPDRPSTLGLGDNIDGVSIADLSESE
jgi:hypothetical protein